MGVDRTEMRSKGRIFFGWYVLAAAFVILFFNAGAAFTMGVLFKPMINEFGWSRGTLSSASFMNLSVYALALIVAGRAYDRYGPKRVILISTILLSAGFMGIFFITAHWQLLVLYGIVAAAGMGGTTVPLFAAILSRWFSKFRGIAISLALSGVGIGQFVIVPLMTKLLLLEGWRMSFFLMGLTMLIVNIPLTLLIVKGNPEDLGLLPLGESGNQPDGTDAAAESGISKFADDLTLFEAMKTRSFWFFTLVMVICGGGDYFVVTHLIPFVTDHGVTATIAGNMFAWFGLLSLLGVVVAGPATDLIGAKIPIALTFLLRVALFVLILVDKSETAFYIFSLGFGFTLLITAPIATMISGKMYGFANIGLISGFITTLHHIGGGACSYIGGALFDKTGSYQSMFVIALIMAATAVLSCIFIKEKRHPKK
jgi:MFS family permease